ncbi:MAG: tetratricopeptide repeat protein [Pseudomonadales bacterium]
MLYVRFQRLIPVMLMLSFLASCTALDPYLNPYYDGEESADSQRADSSASDSSEPRSIDSIVRTRDNGTGESNEFSSLTQAEPAAVTQEQHAQDESILLTAGPNPYLASAQVSNATANAQFSRAISAMDAKDWSAAEGILSELTAQYPELSSPWQNLGVTQARQDKIVEAQKSFEKAIESNAANQEAYNQLGLLHRKQGEFRKAEASYQKAIGVWPAYPEIRLNLGILYELYLGDLGKALQQYTIYQSLLEEPDRRVKGWISDLKRRLQVSST